MRLLLTIITICCLFSCKYGCKKEYLTDEQLVENDDTSNKTGFEIYMENRSSLEEIINGEDAILKEAPWQVSLFSGNDNYLGHFCGGIIIDEHWILTAAHCFYDSWPKHCNRIVYENDFKIFYGSDKLDEKGKTAIVEKIIFKDYLCDGYINDIALIRTRQPLNLSPSGASKIELAENIDIESLEAPNDTAIVTGWGRTESMRTSKVLQKVKVPLVTNDICVKSYPGSIYPSMLCAGYKEGGKDSCSGDSGGPLTIDLSGKRYLIGIVSWGYDCAKPDYYGVYTNVQNFTPWIKETINIVKNNEPIQ